MRKWISFFAFSFVAFGPFVRARAEVRTVSLSVTEMQQSLREQRVSWTAGRTAVSDLGRADRELLLGAPLAGVRTDGQYGQRNLMLENELPEVFDWRDRDGKNFVTPVKNQGRCGSCVAFAAASTFETQMNIVTQSVQHGWGFSPQHLFSCGGGSCSAGWFPGSAVDFLVKTGVPEEACFPYISGAVGSDASCKLSCADSKSRSSKAALRVRSNRFRGAGVDEVKQALLGGPLVTSMRVYDDFYLYKNGVYRHQKGALLGGHAVMIVGWNNNDRAWIARNSWGTDWGEQGDFRIAWDDVSGVGGSYHGLEVTPGFDAVVLEGIRDGQTLRQPTVLKFRSHNLNVGSAVLEVMGKSKTLVTRAFDASGQLVLEPSEFADGTYTFQVRAVSSSSQAKEKISQARLVHIRNAKPSATIKIERMKNNMNVWSTIVPHFVVTSTPVPLSYVQYRIIDTQGNLVRWRRADHTADRVAISLNPKGLVEGRHTLIAEAVSDEGDVLASDRLEFNVTAD
jgi:C1A family cysteine protease